MLSFSYISAERSNFVNKRSKNKKNSRNTKKISVKGLSIIVLTGVLISLGAYFAINSSRPSNGTSPVIGIPGNSFIKAVHTPGKGYSFMHQSTGSSKGLRNLNLGNRTSDPNVLMTVNKGSAETIHLINEDTSHSKHNLNVDEFNVHTRDLGYFESQSVTFIADKAGTFKIYCTIHPEMTGSVIVRDPTEFP
jgi:Cupredoxin-like domain